MLALTNGTLIDGTGRDLIEKATVVVEGNRISSVNLREDYPEDLHCNLCDMIVTCLTHSSTVFVPK